MFHHRCSFCFVCLTFRFVTCQRGETSEMSWRARGRWRRPNRRTEARCITAATWPTCCTTCEFQASLAVYSNCLEWFVFDLFYSLFMSMLPWGFWVWFVCFSNLCQCMDLFAFYIHLLSCAVLSEKRPPCLTRPTVLFYLTGLLMGLGLSLRAKHNAWWANTHCAQMSMVC